jgi:hypothetical protein
VRLSAQVHSSMSALQGSADRLALSLGRPQGARAPAPRARLGEPFQRARAARPNLYGAALGLLLVVEISAQGVAPTSS